jgi:hypothetical protein
VTLLRARVIAACTARKTEMRESRRAMRRIARGADE